MDSPHLSLLCLLPVVKIPAVFTVIAASLLAGSIRLVVLSLHSHHFPLLFSLCVSVVLYNAKEVGISCTPQTGNIQMGI